jgi:2'-5' RNA ligase
VPSPWREALDRARIAAGDPLGGVVPAHITLIPPTVIEAAWLGELEAHLARVVAAFPAFNVRLVGTASFRPVSDVVFVVVDAGAEDCDELAHEIRLGPIIVDHPFPYHAHVTIAQNLAPAVLDRAEAALAGFEAEFEVSSILLSAKATPNTVTGRSLPWTPLAALPLG